MANRSFGSLSSNIFYLEEIKEVSDKDNFEVVVILLLFVLLQLEEEIEGEIKEESEEKDERKEQFQWDRWF